MSGLKRDLWIAELVNKFRHDKEFLRAIPRRDDLVNNDVIHWADIGADPDVLVDNTSYPIASVARTDTDQTVSLNKFQTKRTPVTDDELYALPYDKPGSVIRQHREVLEDKTAEYGIHNIAPTTESDGVTKLVLSTGASNGATQPRKRLQVVDVITAKIFMDTLDVPRNGRVLVLCPDHVEDLLRVSESFQNQYQNIREGQVLRMYGFDIYEFSKTPIYKVVSTVLTKNAMGAAAADADQNSSPFFYAPNVLQALGSVKMYYKRAEDNPEYQQSEINFRLYFKVFPKKVTGFGALVSAIHSQ